MVGLALVLGCPSKRGTPKDAAPAEQTPVTFKAADAFMRPAAKAAALAFRESAERLEKGGVQTLLFARCGDPEGKGPERIERVQDPDRWPEDRLVMVVLVLDAAKRVRHVQLVPMSQSGDWYSQEDFLLDESGRLIYWESYRGTIDSQDQPAKAWDAKAFDPATGQLLEQVAKVVDGSGLPWKEARKIPHPRYRNLQELLNGEGLADPFRKAVAP